MSQAQARYPELVTPRRVEDGRREDGVLYAGTPRPSGVVAVAWRHGSLTPERYRGLGTFRLEQFLLWGWYDADIVARRGWELDPAFGNLPDDAIHVVVGNREGRILAYFDMQPAVIPPPGQKSAAKATPRGASSHATNGHERSGDVTVTTPGRPWFCCEFESYGATVFPSLAAMREVPLGEIRELPCLLRNGTARRPIVALAATYEAIYAMSRVQVDPALGITVTVGIMDVEARAVTAQLGIPVLYAPLAPVVRNGLPKYWRPELNDPGRFWPFVIATPDLMSADAAEHFQRIDALLAHPMAGLARALVEFARDTRQRLTPRALPRIRDEDSELWTADPFWGMAEAGASGKSAGRADDDGTAVAADLAGMAVSATASAAAQGRGAR